MRTRYSALGKPAALFLCARRTNEAIVSSMADDKKKKADPTPTSVMLKMVIVAALLVTVGSFWPSGDSDEAPDTQADDTSVARYACGEFIKQRLVAPSTAKLVDQFDWTAYITTDGKAVVHAKVDAQNSFGAMLRKQFKCEMSNQYGEWTLDNLTEG